MVYSTFQDNLYNPHHFLGLHDQELRLFRPGFDTLYVELLGQMVVAKKVDDSGLFTLPIPSTTRSLDYRVYHKNGMLAHDPYAFSPTWGEVDSHLFSRGVHYQIYNALGSHHVIHSGVSGVKFAVWAPSASAVFLVADFNHWDARVNPMRSMGASGVWELFIPGLTYGEKYKFAIVGKDGKMRLKADPYAQSAEMRPNTASCVARTDHLWEDEKYLEERAKRGILNAPLNIYEVHLGSWKKNGSNFLNYRILAHSLATYCQEMSFTHVELMPIFEHPLDESWGYQVTGFYAVTSRYGTPEDFQYFVDYLHKHKIGVILDWVPAHFPTDDFALAQFDATALYEHQDPRQGFHPHWGSLIFNYGRNEVSNFLIGSALFFFDKMHIDGLRVDAVASMIYLDYGREEGEWLPNEYGGKENLEAIEFLKHLNSIVHKQFPGVLMIAEESTSFAQVSHSLDSGGLGFDFKWNMGWMNDTLRYFSTDSFYRHYHQNFLTFGLIYAFSEHFLLVLSHDEVVHGKKSLLSKMPGGTWQQFANMRLLHSYMMCQPGKKLLFMGAEIGEWDEWAENRELQWHLLQYPIHDGLKSCIQAMNKLYLSKTALWERDTDFTGFEWVDFSDTTNSVVAYLRKSSDTYLLCVHHFTPIFYPEYKLPLKNARHVREVFNTDEERFGGSGKTNPEIKVDPFHVTIQLSPLATLIFEVEFL